MTLARIEIEQVRPDFWSAEIEAGFPTCRRERVTGADIVAVVTAVGEAYERLTGRPVFMPITAHPPDPPAGSVCVSEPTIVVMGDRASPELVAQAKAIGIPADKRWSKARVLREVAKIADVQAPA